VLERDRGWGSAAVAPDDREGAAVVRAPWWSIAGLGVETVFLPDLPDLVIGLLSPKRTPWISSSLLGGVDDQPAASSLP
jgi:hypothetical protein